MGITSNPHGKRLLEIQEERGWTDETLLDLLVAHASDATADTIASIAAEEAEAADDEPEECCTGMRGWDHFGEPYEIERCDTCEKYEDDDQAREAHSKECGCPWGDGSIEDVIAFASQKQDATLLKYAQGAAASGALPFSSHAVGNTGGED